ncbi:MULTISPECIES: hypothetical protein [unclassified Neisseria]|uniref:hypothetical protein n=1 Tax=unclassified Neisseria TaxID=2623750 RepID=UPI00266718BF|nr:MULTISPECIES: hypothetical protein [unclassified Neisseria]MDO1517145.1 hypothetical protein [Neisseria sp. MVDL18-041461]MDO1564508.1 hypothetical protein [Neisseria sp. MVDL20-010259]
MAGRKPVGHIQWHLRPSEKSFFRRPRYNDGGEGAAWFGCVADSGRIAASRMVSESGGSARSLNL